MTGLFNTVNMYGTTDHDNEADNVLTYLNSDLWFLGKGMS